MLNLKEQIISTDWTVYDGPMLYNSNIIASSLVDLLELVNPLLAEKVGNQLINSIGNNHAGVYYPVVLKALDYLISIEEGAYNKVSKTCAIGVMNDLYYFKPEIGSYAKCNVSELEAFVKNKLRDYSDENIEEKLR